jgi:phosphoribosyl 1,2-cyclic phosphodiesterase
MAFYITFWGTRGSIPTPGYRTRIFGGNTSCVEIRSDDTLLVCDGGSGLRELGLDLMSRGKFPIVGHLFFSHAHWDHIQGFPFFVPAYVPNNTFYVYGTTTGDTRFHRLLSGQMQSDYFPVNFSELGAKILPRDLGEGLQIIEGVTVKVIEQRHQGPSFAYSFEQDGRKIVYATDHELDLVVQNAAEAQASPLALRQMPEAFVKFVEGADLLISDGQYTDEEYPKKVNYGHPRATTVVDLAVQAKVKQVAITHHDPLQSDDDVNKKIEACRARANRFSSTVVVFGAREGLELKVS